VSAADRGGHAGSVVRCEPRSDRSIDRGPCDERTIGELEIERVKRRRDIHRRIHTATVRG